MEFNEGLSLISQRCYLGPLGTKLDGHIDSNPKIPSSPRKKLEGVFFIFSFKSLDLDCLLVSCIMRS